MALQHRPSTSASIPASNPNDLQRRVQELEQALQLAQVQLLSRQEAIDKMFKEKYGSLDQRAEESVVDEGDEKNKGKLKEDVGYFNSYSGNGKPDAVCPLCNKFKLIITFLTLFCYRNSRDDAQRHDTDRRIPRFHSLQFRALQRCNSTRRRLRHGHLINDGCKSGS